MEVQPNPLPIDGWFMGLIKLVKQPLHAITTEKILTDETLQTNLCEVESILNKCPLTPISSDINDLEAITPNHLLIAYQNNMTFIHKFNTLYKRLTRSL